MADKRFSEYEKVLAGYKKELFKDKIIDYKGRVWGKKEALGWKKEILRLLLEHEHQKGFNDGVRAVCEDPQDWKINRKKLR